MTDAEFRDAVEQHAEELSILERDVSALKKSIQTLVRLCQNIKLTGIVTPQEREAFESALRELQDK